ncbi:MFS transporter [Tepidimonas taiwanensis]|uniref:Inner membrane transport protein YajR n=1 Tax=Tepidimonas taiwanensis TaxID=307486 RepID=A0A554X128_9BURK|nr:MFS transporter [Tepidimonas taiwanensis]MDM7462574.1 MFS transporter [Tepidimonas taiwanensis]TSE29537.1 Inner membrane transport protein YajR [Tepidimonas taiwanensis]UBQ06877.1 MFS transporter [Tepidimonas taiwanensis]
MQPAERRASLTLAGVFALRMLGLFLVLPVFALEAARLPGGDDPARVGLAMGIYGLAQALLQIPLGAASDRFGRKRVIIAGLALFALGSVWAALATSIDALILARALQGAGAISAAVTALLADLTRDAVRTKAMALVGVSIAVSFALSLVAAPPLASAIGLSGLFALTAALSLAGIAAVAWVVPAEPARPADDVAVSWRRVLRHPDLWRLDVGVFALHTVQMAMWVAVPGLLVAAGLPKAAHWQVYLPALVASFLIMGGVLFRLERRGYLAAVLRVAIGLLAVAQLGFAWAGADAGIAVLAVWLVVFFLGFNTLEASQPSLVSRLAPAGARGAALGVYNTLQSLGLFAGGALGGWLVRQAGATGVFTAGAVLCLAWLALSWRLRVPAATPKAVDPRAASPTA